MESLVPVDAAVSTRSDIEAHRVPVVNHDARRTQVSPAFFRIVGDINAAGADVPATILLEPTRSRKRQKIDVFAAANVFQHGSFSNHGWRNIFESLGSLAPLRDESQRVEILWHSQTQPEPPGRAQRVDQDTITFRIVFDGIEEYCGRAPPLRDNIRHTANL